jgi:hypothetical protein
MFTNPCNTIILMNSSDNQNNSGFTPIDPAFRPPTPSPASTDPNSLILPADPPTTASDIPSATPPSSSPPSPSPSPSPGAAPSSVPPQSNADLNLTEFPSFEDPQDGESETKRVFLIGGGILGSIVVISSILFFITKNKEKTEVVPTEGAPETIVEIPLCTCTYSNNTCTCTCNNENALCEIEEKSPSLTIPLEPPTDQNLKKITILPSETLLTKVEESFSEVTDQNLKLEFFHAGETGEESLQPLTLNDFSNNLNIFIPQYVTDISNLNYHFFLTRSSPGRNPSSVLVFDSKLNSYKDTEQVLKKWETYMVEDLKQFLLIGEDFDPITGQQHQTFQSSSIYPGGRYLNFLKDGSLSINYIVIQDQIIISNDFKALEQTIEYIKNNEAL